MFDYTFGTEKVKLRLFIEDYDPTKIIKLRKTLIDILDLDEYDTELKLGFNNHLAFNINLFVADKKSLPDIMKILEDELREVGGKDKIGRAHV